MHLRSANSGLFFSALDDLVPLVSFQWCPCRLVNNFQLVILIAWAIVSRQRLTTSVVSFRLFELHVPWLQGDKSFVWVVLDVMDFKVHVECNTRIFGYHLPVW